jgi:hypothetical protein
MGYACGQLLGKDVEENSCRLMMFFYWVLTSCKLVSRFQHFRETYCLHGDSMSNVDANISKKHTVSMETVCFSEMLASTDKSVWHQNPEEYHHPHCCKNLKSHTVVAYFRVLSQHLSERTDENLG